MNAIPLVRNDFRIDKSMNRVTPGEPIGSKASAMGGGSVSEKQLRQEVNTSIVALKREAFSLETLLAKAAQELISLNNRISALEGDYVKKSDVTDTVESGNSNPVSSQGVKTAIDALGAPSVGGSGKYISAISETDGVISATASDLSTTPTSGSSAPITSGAVHNINFQGVKYGANYDCNTMGEGLALINEQTLNSPYKQGLTTNGIAYLLTRSIASSSGWYRMQIVITYRYNDMFTRTYTDSGWSAWRKVTCLKEKQIRIDDTSGYTLQNGVYVKTLSGFFADNGIDYSKVVNIQQVNNGNYLYPYFFISYGLSDSLKVFKFANINNTYVDIKVYYE